MNPKGTDFQKKVWQELLKIPYGKTESYQKITNKLGDPKAIRAVANANGKNPLWIVIPCHRVIGSDGSLTGYAGGLWRKKWLLDHENPIKQERLF
jgi:methylated-DNA-[protein]-cysteine S-methyltransferase